MKAIYISDHSANPRIVDLRNVYELIDDAPITTHRKHIAGRQYDIVAGLGAGRRITAYDSQDGVCFSGNIVIKSPEGDITAEDIAHINKNLIMCNSAWITWAALVNVEP